MDPAVRPHTLRLNGWKEIAAHFGRTVRTVQRWERELGLPVHRLSAGKGETVFALPAELDGWLVQNERAPGGPGSADPNGSGSREIDPGSGPGALPARPAGRSFASLLAVFLVGVAVIAIVLLVAWHPPGTVGGERRVPSSFKRDGQQLTVLDQSGQVLWTWRAPFPLSEREYSDQPGVPAFPRVLFTDLEGDGSIETVFCALGGVLADSAVYVFEQDGTMRFGWEYQGQKRFGDVTYSSPWRIAGVVLRPAGSREEIWVALFHIPWFPSALVRLDAKGKVTGEFWHPGYVTAVVPATIGGREVLVVGASNNDFRSSALAVVDPDVPTTAPALRPDYACADCPGGRPLHYLVFPRTTLARQFDPVGAIQAITVDAAGQMVVAVEQLGVSLTGMATPAQASVHYVFDSNMRPVSAELGETYVRAYRELLAQKRFTAPPNFDEQSELWPVRKWDGSAFVPLQPPPR